MRILLSSVGSRGDVQPLLALALCLQGRGHNVLLATPSEFEYQIESSGVPFASLGTQAAPLMRAVSTEGFLNALSGQVDQHFERLVEIAASFDVLVSNVFQFAGPSVAELHNLPFWNTTVAPVYLKLISGFNWFPSLVEAVARGRRAYGLAPSTNLASHILSKPFLVASDPEFANTDIPPGVTAKITGSWKLPPRRSICSKLVEFCRSGAPPVYIGFGSMVIADSERMARTIQTAISSSNSRYVINIGSSGMKFESLPAACYTVSDANHSELFPYCAAVLHHGGAGTTSMAAYSGIPQGIIPELADQHYWGRCVRSLGIGMVKSTLRSVSADDLLHLVKGLTEEKSFSIAAKRFSRKLLDRDGAVVAADVIVHGLPKIDTSIADVNPPFLYER